MSRIQYFFVPESRAISMSEKPLWVQTVIPQNPIIGVDGSVGDNPDITPSFPRDEDTHWAPLHHQHVFYEDQIHDWTWKEGHLRYFSRAAKAKVWIRVEFADGFVNFSDVARSRCGLDAAECAKYVEGFERSTDKIRLVYPALGEGLRFRGAPKACHHLRIHEDDVNEFVRRVIKHLTKIGAL